MNLQKFARSAVYGDRENDRCAADQIAGAIVRNFKGSFDIVKTLGKGSFASVEPIHITIRQGGKFYIADGHHRYVAATMLGRDTIPATIKHIEDNPIVVLRTRFGLK